MHIRQDEREEASGPGQLKHAMEEQAAVTVRPKLTQVQECKGAEIILELDVVERVLHRHNHRARHIRACVVQSRCVSHPHDGRRFHPPWQRSGHKGERGTGAGKRALLRRGPDA